MIEAFVLQSESDLIDENKLKICKEIQDLGQYCWISQKRAIENYIPYQDFLNAIRSVYKITASEDVILNDGEFENRSKIIDKSKKTEFRPTIQIPNEIWTIIQRNGNGSTSGIDAKLLRQTVETALQSSGNQNFTISKILVAEEVVRNQPAVQDAELI
ncbi:MAG: hypothetical protein WBP41_18025 [Saprospiraceae bacterium]